MNRLFYIIRHKPSGGCLPEVNGTRGGYTHTEPTTFLPPRLFLEEGHAKRALTWWLKGITSVYRHHDSFTSEYDETWHLDTNLDTPRVKAAMEIVEVHLNENSN